MTTTSANKSDAKSLQFGFRMKLLSWFATNRRDLPWRKNVTPYSVWVSEIMLQQTVVATAIPYFERWRQRFPDVESLATASEREVLRFWEGLGYYARARNLHRAARILVTDFAGALPNDREQLRSLPGIGEYTASAIMSIAFGEEHPVFDANVRRVVRRFLGQRTWSKTAERRARSFVAAAIPNKNPGAFNEAVMELGQSVCLNRNPKCSTCPLHSHCRAYKLGLQDSIPGSRTGHTQQRESKLILLLNRGRLLATKKEQGLFAGLWVLPKVAANHSASSLIKSLANCPDSLAPTFAGSLRKRTHHYTQYAERLTPVIYELERVPAHPADGWHWLRLDRLESYPFPSVYRSILNDLRDSR